MQLESFLCLITTVNPGAPFNVSVSIYTLSSITLAWNPPLFDGLDDILGYKVAVSRLGGVSVANVSSANTSVVIPSLQYNTLYTFEVKAVNRVGASPGTVYSFVILPEGLNIHVYEHRCTVHSHALHVQIHLFLSTSVRMSCVAILVYH